MQNKFFLKGAIIIVITAPFLFGQTLPELSLKSKKFHSVKNPQDSLTNDSTFTTEKPKTSTSKKFRMHKSPTKAVLLSAVLPGAGQFYNESYWKVPIIAGLVGYFGYEYFNQNSKYKDYKEQYENSQTPENPAGDLNLKQQREFYRDQRDNFVWYFMIVYVINLVDAYVDAHLFDFDVKDEKIEGMGKIDRKYRIKFNLKF